MDQEAKEQKQASIADFEVLSKLGKGSFGTVYKVKRKYDKKMYVIKQINISQLNKNLTTVALNEVQILSSLENPFIVKYFDSFLDKNYLNIVMEHCEGGDIANYIRGQLGKPIAENTIWKFLIQMCLGLRYIHNKRILHRDIKSLNVFLTKEQDIRIGDLGVAKVMSAESLNFAKKAVGTPYYMSPEICEEKPYNEKSDIWSLGCILYELCAQKHPFDANNHGALVLKIMRGKYDPVPVSYSNELSEIIELCLSKDYNKRPSADELLYRPLLSAKAKTLGIRLSVEEKIPKQILTPNQQPNQENSNISAANPPFKKISQSPTKKIENSSSKAELRDKTPQKSSETKPKKDLQNNNLFQVYQNIKSPSSEIKVEQRIKTAKIPKEGAGMDYLKLVPDRNQKPVKPQTSSRISQQESPRKNGGRGVAALSQLIDEKPEVSFQGPTKLLEMRSSSCTNTAFEDSTKKVKNGRDSPSTSVKARPLPITPRNLDSFSTAAPSKLTILDNAKRSFLLKPQPPIKSGKFGDDDDHQTVKFPAIKQQPSISERDNQKKFPEEKTLFQKTQFLKIERYDSEESVPSRKGENSFNHTPRRLIIKTKKSEEKPMNSPKISIKRPEIPLSLEENKIDAVIQQNPVYTNLSKALEKDQFYANIVQKNEKSVNEKKRNQLQQLMKERSQYFINRWGEKAYDELTTFLRTKIDKKGEKAEIGMEEFLNDKLRNKVEPEQVFYIVNKILPIEYDLGKIA